MYDKRRIFLKISALIGLGLTLTSRGHAKANVVTPSEGEGPFYPIAVQADQDFDLTRIEGRAGKAIGKAVFIEGRVLDETGEPVSGAMIDLWQANSFGRYRHPFDQSDQPLDDNFQGWAIIQSDETGGFRFKTVVPGAYPAGQGWVRPPHLHFKVNKLGFIKLTTQMYFPEQKLNEKDLLLKQKSDSQQQAMIASSAGVTADGEIIYRYDIVLRKA